jgi:hypothetical protein
MASINGGLLALIIFLGIGSCVLLILGFSNIHSSLHGDSQEQVMQVTAPWHKQPKVLFGVNNVVLAFLLFFLLLLVTLASQIAQLIVVGLVVLTLALSITLVVLTIKAAMSASKKGSYQQSQQEDK